MSDILISNLPTYSASTVTGTYFIINNSENTETFKATREQFIPINFGQGTCTSVGGSFNTAVGNCSSVLGGESNCVSGSNSTILGGSNNSVTASCSAAFGAGITASDDLTLYANNLCGVSSIKSPYIYSTGLLSGCAVCVGDFGLLCSYTAGGGGSSPMVNGTGTCSIVGNCTLNSNGGACSFVGGGQNNMNGLSIYSFIGGGQSNSTNACYQVVNGGQNNCLGMCNFHSTIGGGYYNIPGGFGQSQGITIAGGIGNGSTGGIYDGNSNCWSEFPSSFSMCSFSSIGGGFQNNAIGCGSVVSGGMNNTNCATLSFIGGGQCNKILAGYHDVLIGGCCNSMASSGFLNVIVGGTCNSINCSTGYSFIGGGTCNTLGCNNMSACFNNLIGGTKASMDGQFGFIGNSTDCNIFGGSSNSTKCGTYGATILNGQCNNVCGSPAPGSVNCFGTILGGCGNTTNCNFNLVYGSGVNMSGSYSNGFGCGLMGMANCTTYFNNICVCGTISKMSGSFKIPHPDPSKTDKFLQHSFVESPTAGENIYRYLTTITNCSSSFELPDYYKFLNGNDQVFVTPKNHFGSAYGIINQEQTCVSFCSNCDGEYNVLIIGTRKDKEALKYWKGTEVEEVQQ